MNAALFFALWALLAQAGQAPSGTPDVGDLLADQIASQSESVLVRRTSKDGDPETLDVVAHGAPAHEILKRVADAVGRSFRIIDTGEALLRANALIDVQLRSRPLLESATWIAGAAGLTVEISRKEIKCGADVSDRIDPTQMLRHAIDGWRLALLAKPLQADAARLRFQIANADYQLGDFAKATIEYLELEKSAPDFGDLPAVYFRCGAAYAKLGDDNSAAQQWTAIGNLFPHHPLVASARLEAVRAYRRLSRDPATPDRAGAAQHADTVLRQVVESRGSGLAPEDLVSAGELLEESGRHGNAIKALQWALQSTSDPALTQRALLALAHAQADDERWTDVITTARRYLALDVAGVEAAEMEYRLALAHRRLDDPFTTLLAVARAREFLREQKGGTPLSLKLDLLEGEVYAASGLAARAEKCLSRAGAADDVEVAARALALRARLQREAGQYEAATATLTRLAKLRGHEGEGQIGLAEVALDQRNPELCLDRVREALPTVDVATRARLLEIAAGALKDGDSIEALLQSLEAAPAATPAGAENAPPATAPADDPSAPPAGHATDDGKEASDGG
jgi:tetratricopeptide (TPR) repeat protein